ncbi:MAG TPA: hypothetical protein DD727_02700 [Clostridiales bacterium]|nr:hypothetical protein [Clostridiales bacterium]
MMENRKTKGEKAVQQETTWDFIGEFIRIRNTRVYGLEESIVASSYPMLENAPEPAMFNEKVRRVGQSEDGDADVKRSEKLGQARPGSGHDCFLKGIIVQADFELPQYLWQQAKRYHWFDFVSSQSTMHRITRMSVAEHCNAFVDPGIIRILEEMVRRYREETGEASRAMQFQRIVANIPSGFLLTARITTSYLQLKTMVRQRSSHRLSEWKEFQTWCSGLPLFSRLALKSEE